MKKITALALPVAAFLGSASSVFAEVSNVTINPCPGGQTGGGFQNLCNISFSGGIVQSVITIAFIVATLIALAFLIFGGIKWITSGGDKAGVEGARNMIVAALVGLVIVFLSYFILRLVFDFFGLTFTTFKLPSLSSSNS